MKYPLIVASISVLLSACVTNDKNDNADVKQNNSVLMAPVQSAEVKDPDNSQVITLEKIMSDPDWIARSPSSWYWGDDNQTIFYKQKRLGNPLTDLYTKSLTEQGNGEKVSLANLHAVADKHAVRNIDGTKEVYTFEGNVFVKDLTAKSITQITFTSAVEKQPMFLSNGNVAYRVDNVFYEFDTNKNQVRELVNLQLTNTPGVSRTEQTYISKEQHKLIKYVALQKRNADLRAEQKSQLRTENNTIATSVFYFGEGKRIVDAQLSPNAQMMVVSVTKNESWNNPGDIMPNYINSEATIDAVPARRRVSDNRKYEEQLYLLDLVNNAQYVLDYKTLPGFDEDVLASVKAENYAREGKEYKSSKQARNIHLIGRNSIQWHNDSKQVAIMLEAWDNKDRWIATIDFENKQLVNQHRLHDDAWINWAFNDFGWFNNSETLYFTSEQSGYGHLYIKAIDGDVKALTQGQYEVRNLTLTGDDNSFYFKGNKKHPGIYEIYHVDVNSAKLTAVTDLGGRNEYQLSPDETKLLIEHSTTTMPPELYVQDIATDAEAVQLTHTVTQEFLSMPWTAPTVVEVPSSHTKQGIFSKIYQAPKGEVNATVQGKAVMFVHGAGYLQNSHLGWSVYFREFMFHSMLVQKGYTVIDMDYRASSGYGRDWRTAIYRQMGTPEVEDMLDGVNWLVANANVDKNRVGVYGGSYGGFLTLMSMFKEPDVFASGSALRLVSDWTSYNHGYTSNILNTPEDDKIAFERSSPIYFAEGLQKPLLINAPMVDDNVFFQDSVRLVQRLIELEKENFETAIYPVEPHGFVQPSSWLDEYRRIFKLFETTL
ncbi:S9 family peptidase [Thalassomonas sp. M1454]|uniref:S9 family peptidase n=1 Tax=Thalassomonas sp. M1454 TaxID=2594477 RepID=UPI00117D2F83|nr:prolyl oligopeptidase family serine peptidase [Thalassomonas sp. M1454]TRX57018.1 S9 family peptidase [Thalassomonas sp. M1454]